MAFCRIFPPLVMLAVACWPVLVPAEPQKDKPVAKQVAQPPPGARGYVPLTPEKRAYYQDISRKAHGNRLAMMAKNQALPAAFDCRDKVPLPVWDQGQCGSCYLVATVRQATDALLRLGYGKADNSFMMSAQFGMDRPRNFGGCNGGNGTEVIDWMCKNGWVAEVYADAQGAVHNDYPAYQASSGNDRTKPGAKKWMVGATWGYVNANGNPTTAEIKAAIYNFGRLNVALDAGGQFSNGTGTITALGRNIDHEICMVAYDDAKDGGAFLLENQWGISYGVKGCRWVTYAAAKNLVDIFFVSAGALPPPPPPDPPIPPDPKPPIPPIPGKVAIQLTAEQVQSVLQQAGGIVVNSNTTLQQLVDQIRKNEGNGNGAKEPPTEEKSRLDLLERDMREMRRAVDAILNALLPREATPQPLKKGKS